MTYTRDQSGTFEKQGISLSTYSAAGYSDSSISDLIAAAGKNGANHIVLSNIVMADLSTNVIGDVIEDGRNQTASLASVGSAIAQAQAAGMNVVLKPQIAVHDAAYDQYNSASWINMVNPDLIITNPAGFFASYKAVVMQWAALAQQYHVDTLCIGNEMVAATKPEYTPYWDDIIASVRSIYDGKLTYAALAPVMTNSPSNEIAQIGFWDKLDYAGFDVYPSLYHGTAPDVADLNAGWHDATVYGHPQDYAAFLNDMAALVGKPVVFTETGLPSFDGASDREATSDGTIGNGTHANDQGEQATWWQSFFETWGAHTPDWLKGVYVTNNDPGDLGSYYDQNYNIDGKLAEPVVAAWFGGHTDLNVTTGTVNGSQADDRLYAYDPTVNAAGDDLAAHLTTTVQVVVTAGIVSGRVPTIHAYINGVDFGQIALQPLDSGYVDADGVHWSTNATYTFTLPGLVAVDDLKIGFDSPAVIDGARSQTFFHSVSVNGVELSSASYHPAVGNGGPYAETLPVEGQGGSSSQWAGGYTLFDATPWNRALSSQSLGSADHPIDVNGGDGTDNLHLLGPGSDYSILRHADGTVDVSDAGGRHQNAHLEGVEWLSFADGTHVDLGALASEIPYVPAGADVSGGSGDPAPGAGAVSPPDGTDSPSTGVNGSGDPAPGAGAVSPPDGTDSPSTDFNGSGDLAPDAGAVSPPDGTDSPSTDVNDAYLAWGGRDAAAAEITYWTGELAAGRASMGSVRAAILDDPLGISHTHAVVAGLYQDYGGRAPTADEQAFWLDAVRDGTTFEVVRSTILDDTLGQTYTRNEVTALYQTLGGRSPVADELSFWKDAIRNHGANLATVRDAILADPLGISNTHTVVAELYQTYGGRAPNADEQTYWLNAVRSGTTYDGVRSTILADPLGQTHTTGEVTQQYEAFFGREPTADEQGTWHSLVAQGATFDVLTDTLLKDAGSAGRTRELRGTVNGDMFDLTGAFGHVVIQDFDPAHDMISFSKEVDGPTATLDALHAMQVTALDGSTDVLIRHDGSDVALIAHIALADLSSANLHLI